MSLEKRTELNVNKSLNQSEKVEDRVETDPALLKTQLDTISGSGVSFSDLIENLGLAAKLEDLDSERSFISKYSEKERKK